MTRAKVGYAAMLEQFAPQDVVGFTAFAYCLHELPASVVGTYAYVNPVVAVVLGAVLLGEPLSASLLAGAAMILSAVLLATVRRRPPQPLRPLGVAEEQA